MIAMSIIVLDWIINAGYVTLVIPFVMLMIRFRKSKKAYRWYACVLATHLVIAVSSEILYRHNINPNYAGSLDNLIVIVFYVGFFLEVIGSAIKKNILYFLAAAQIIFSALNLIFIQKETLNTYSAISLSAIILSLCLLFFYRLLKQLPTEDLLSLPAFWFIAAEFMVNTGQMLMKSFAHFLINIFNDNLIILWVFHHGLGIIGYIVITYGAWLAFNETHQQTKNSIAPVN